MTQICISQGCVDRVSYVRTYSQPGLVDTHGDHENRGPPERWGGRGEGRGGYCGICDKEMK
jgi:hypothetical protein